MQTVFESKWVFLMDLVWGDFQKNFPGIGWPGVARFLICPDGSFLARWELGPDREAMLSYGPDGRVRGVEGVNITEPDADRH